MKPLGVGLVFVPALLPLFRDGDEAVSVLEIEPQTLLQLSRRGHRDSYGVNRQLLAELSALPQKKTLHSVGLPVGGSRPLDPVQVELLVMMADLLDVPWVSEHLSFDAFYESGSWTTAGFLLPPFQCSQTVNYAARKLRALARALRRPTAFETGVNYLSAQPNELDDGQFFSSVAEIADCGILLDLHNLWTNECNGRQRVSDVLKQLPLERVWEIHLAGGMSLDGHWLDAHSGAVPPPVLDFAAEWIPKMPNLGALIFEILEDNVAGLGLDGVARQIERMHSLWALRRPRPEVTVHVPGPVARAAEPSAGDLVGTWERSLGALAIGRDPAGELASRLNMDPGLEILRKLVTDSRSSFISKGLPHTMSLLLGSLGSAETRELLAEFMRSHAPELFVSAEADAFACFLEERSLTIPYLGEVLGFEQALIRSVLYGEESTVIFDHEPVSLLGSLEHGRVPREPILKKISLIVRDG